MPTNNVIFQTLGTLCLWVGWYGFNGVSTLVLSGYTGVAAHAMITSTLSAASCCLVAVLLEYLLSGPERIISITAANNGILGGLVAVTSSCATCTPVGAMFIGVGAAFAYTAGDRLLTRFKIDDVVGAVQVHLCCGLWGLIAPGLFTEKGLYAKAYFGDRAERCEGVFYGGKGHQLAAQLVWTIAQFAWVFCASVFVFYACKATLGVRVSKEVEESGLDDSKHGGRNLSVVFAMKGAADEVVGSVVDELNASRGKGKKNRGVVEWADEVGKGEMMDKGTKKQIRGNVVVTEEDVEMATRGVDVTVL